MYSISFTPRQAVRSLFLMTLLSSFPSVLAAEASSHATDDHFISVAGASITFSVTALLSNDGAVGGTVQLVSEPGSGTLSGSADTGFIYAPEAGTWGRDWVEYELAEDSTTSRARVVFHVSPPRTPVAGAWWADDANTGVPDPGHPLVPGFERELGWWDHATGTLVLCDWDGELVHSCATKTPSAAVGKEGWTPWMADLDQDGRDEFLLHDPSTGAVALYAIRQTEPLPAPFELEPLLGFDFGGPGERLLSGRWTAGAVQVGRYSEAGGAGKFWLEDGSTVLGLSLENPPSHGVPVVGDFFDHHRDHVGVYDMDRAELTLMDPLEVSAARLLVSAANFELNGPVFSGRISSQGRSSFLGAMHWQELRFRLVGILGQLDPDLGPIPIDVTIDPPN